MPIGYCLLFLMFVVFSAHAETEEFFVVPEKPVNFVDRKTKQSINVANYYLYYDTKFDCLDIACKKFRGNNTSNTAVSGGVGAFKTVMTKIPRLPNSGPLTLSFVLPGVCKSSEKCTASMSLEEFIAAREPVVLTYDYDEEATKSAREKRKEAERKAFAEIDEKLDNKKTNDDFAENRRKLNPMSYTEETFNKLSLNAWQCNESLADKISKCEVHACIYPTRSKESKIMDDVVIHGLNRVGNCAISLPGGKRFFVPKPDLVFFYDAFVANWGSSGLSMNDPCESASVAALCREKKNDLLFQLNARQLVKDYVPVRIGTGNEK